MPNFPRPHTYKTCLCFCFLSPSLIIFYLVPLSFSIFPSGTGLAQSLFSSTTGAFPPCSLPGIPESILAIENVKNEEKAEEGTRSTAAGRVLSNLLSRPKVSGSSSGCAGPIKSYLTLTIKTGTSLNTLSDGGMPAHNFTHET